MIYFKYSLISLFYKKTQYLNTNDNILLSIDNILLSFKEMETKLRIISLLEECPKGIHLRELARLLETGLPNVVRFVKILEKEKSVAKEKEANLIKIKLTYYPKTIAYLKEIHTEKFLALPKKAQFAISDFLSELKTKPLIALIFGSYAKKSFNEDSDIDLLLVFQDITQRNNIDDIAKKISMKNNINISPIYVNYDNFSKNFLDKNHQFSREIRQKVILLNGSEYYYELLEEFLK